MAKGDVKMSVLNQVSYATKQTKILPDGKEQVTLIGYFTNKGKSTIEITFVEGGSIREATVRHRDAAGRQKDLTVSCVPAKCKIEVNIDKTKNDGDKNKIDIKVDQIWRYRVKKFGVQIYLNEWIWQLNNIAAGNRPVAGEYNHFLPRATGYEEMLGINEGDVCSKQRNDAHKALFMEVKNETGLWIKARSSGNAYLLLKQEKITAADVLKLGIQKNGYVDLT